MLLLAACSHQHDFGEWHTITAATCDTPGYKIQKCRCGQENSGSIPALGHKYKLIDEGVPSCQEEGYKAYECIKCKHSYRDPIEQDKFTATELNEKYLQSVGEIIVYNINREAISLGSCVVYSEDGLLITNYHVIEDGYCAEVIIGYRTYSTINVVAYDKQLDLAILKIAANNLQPATFCDLSHKTGETVYALGNSQGLAATFSKGMITYSDRESEGVHYVQHDAAISSGNSGGPLINEYGEVIGINTLTIMDSQNLNFAISISELDRLSYISPITITELYNQEYGAYRKTATYLLKNGTYRTDSGTYRLMMDTYQTASFAYTIWAEYIPNKDEIDFYLKTNDGLYTVIRLDNQCSGTYNWLCSDDCYLMSGTVIAQKVTSNTQLTYTYTNVTSNPLLENMLNAASASVLLICDCITYSFSRIGVTAADFGFVNF